MIKNLTRVHKTFTQLSKINKFQFASLNFQQNSDISAEWKSCDFLEKRHIGPNNIESESTKKLLQTVGVDSIDQLIKEVIPPQVIDEQSLNMNGQQIPPALTESQMLEHMRELGKKNKLYKTYIGEGFYDNHTPLPILRNVFENPGWYTAYTPYQAEVSQGRLENLLNFQTMITELTGLDISNASLLDESSAGAESVLLAHNIQNGKRSQFFISENLFPVTKDVIKSRAEHLGIEIIEGDEHTFDFDAQGKNISGVLVQNPDNRGQVHDYTEIFDKVKKQKCVPIIAVDLLSLTMVKTPKEMGAEIAIGNSQRFGVPLGYGGPHAGYLASIDKHKRKLPGRIIGVTKDSYGNKCYRMSLQTREQHIKREKATSNICTAQALLANIAGFYGIYHGPNGLKNIGQRVNKLTSLLALNVHNSGFEVFGYDPSNQNQNKFFDTIRFSVENSRDLAQFLQENYQINIRIVDNNNVQVSFDETTTLENVFQLVNALRKYKGEQEISEQEFSQQIQSFNSQISENLLRQSDFMQQAVYNSYHTETNLMRYMTYLERKDISLNKSMIALGSCTMKLNAASQLIPVTWPEFGKLHPYVPFDQSQGYVEMIKNITEYLKIITKFDAFSLQPNSGATGEYAGLLAIKEYLKSIGQSQRNVCIIPISAHGTNPASAVLAGFKTVIVNATKNGQVDVDDLKAKVEKHKDTLGAFMITYPSTCGIYEDKIIEIIDIIHQNGGQVYMDGANMNAQVGYTSPGFLGADVCHLNLHKTFAIPHGGGGPGLGPIGVKKHLEPFLPSHQYGLDQNNKQNNITVAQSPFSSASIIPITYSYIRQLGTQGMRNSTAIAILNANYLYQKLKDHYQIVYSRNGRCAHEFIIDIRPFKNLGIQGIDVAKRLQDFSFHAPTMSFPIPNTLMIEPTESEDIEELDRLAEALIFIRKEIQMIEDGVYSQDDNPLINSPHTEEYVVSGDWKHNYSRQVAAYPLPWVQKRGKQWPSVGRSDEAFGDRNFVGIQQNEKTF